jgi:pimeloyl-ACP methyl ester carboxylesterase
MFVKYCITVKSNISLQCRFDLPAMLGHMMAVTGQDRFHYIGHSMGTLSYYTACNYHPWIGRRSAIS